MDGLLTKRLVRSDLSALDIHTDIRAGKTLVGLAYNNSPKPTFFEATTYDKACPAKNDPLPGRGAF